MRQFSAFVLKIATVAIALIGLLFATLSLSARGKSARDLMANPISRHASQLIRFQSLVFDRHAACPVSEAWRLASPEYAASFEDVASSLKTLRTDGRLSQVQTSYGQIWMPSRDIAAVPETFLDQQQGIYQPAGNGVRAGDVVLDCGANIGIYTKYALSKGASKVIAIEIAPEDIECLRRTFASEIASGSVIVYPKGVWDSDTTLELSSSQDRSSMGNTVMADMGGGGGVKVPLTTIDKIVSELSLQRVDFIKMDIEGAEAHALQGARDTLNRFRPRLAIALEHRRTDPDDLPLLVRSNWPFYEVGLSNCAIKGGAKHIQPNVMYAHAK